MKIIKYLSIVVILLLVLVAGLVVTLYLVDINQYKGAMAQQITKLTGREFTINGDCELSISLQPRILLRDVHMKNASWGSQTEMLKIGEAELQVAFIPLLISRIKVLKLSISDLNIVLEKNKENKSNWDMGSGEAKSKSATDSGSGGLTMEIALYEILVRNARILYNDNTSKKATRLTLQYLKGNRLDNDFVQWDLAAKIDNTPVAIQGRTSVLHNLLSGQPFESHLGGNLGNIEFTLDGSMILNDGLGSIDMKTTLKAPDLKTVTELTQAELPAVGPIAIQAKLSDTDKAYKIDLSSNLADMKLMLKGLIGKSLDGKGMKVEYDVEAPDLKSASIIAGTKLPDVGPIKVSGTVADSKGSYLLTLNGAVADLKIDADGRIADSLDGKGVELNLALLAPDLQQVGKLGGAELPPVGPLDVRGKLNDIEGGYSISDLKAKIGKSDLNGDVSIVYQSKPAHVKASLSSTRLDLTQFQKQEAGTTAKPAAKNGKAQVAEAPASGRIFPDTPLPFDQLKMVNADIKYAAQEIETGTQALRNVKLALKLDNGRLELKPVQMQVAKGSIQGDATLDASQSKSQAAIALNLQAKDLVLGNFKQLKGAMSGGSTRIKVQLQGSGGSVRQVMAGLNGETIVDVGTATLNNDTINLVGGGVFLKFLGALAPKKDRPATVGLECAVVKFNIQDGIANSNEGIVIKSEDLIIVGKGNIDLKTEQIDLKFASRSRSLNAVDTGDLTRVVGLGGTLASPAPAINIEGVAKTGATIGAAVLTLGASYVAQKVIDAALRDDNPCRTALNKAPQADGEAADGEKKAATTVKESKAAPKEKAVHKDVTEPKEKAVQKDVAEPKRESAPQWNEGSLPVQ